MNDISRYLFTCEISVLSNVEVALKNASVNYSAVFITDRRLEAFPALQVVFSEAFSRQKSVIKKHRTLLNS